VVAATGERLHQGGVEAAVADEGFVDMNADDLAEDQDMSPICLVFWRSRWAVPLSDRHLL
jgi:hypothetical protein